LRLGTNEKKTVSGREATMKFPFWRRRRDRELDEEIHSHLQMATSDHIERGESPEQAQISARRNLGSPNLIKDITRQMWGLMWLERLMQDLRYGIRMLLRQPSFTVVVVLSLALGIGANTAIFSVVNVLLFKPLPYPQSDRLMALEHRVRYDRGFADYWSYPTFNQFRTESKSYQQIASYFEANCTLTISDEPENAIGEIVSADYFQLFGLNASLGRTFLPE
jgi:hypothetical protein